MILQTPIDIYLNNLSEADKEVLENLRQIIRTEIPDADELITYQIPTFKVDGKAVVGFAAYKNHFSFFPFSGGLLTQFKNETKNFDQTRGSLHFTAAKPIPDELVRRMVKIKLAMNMKKKLK